MNIGQNPKDLYMNFKSTSDKPKLSTGPKSMLPENHAKPQMQATSQKAPLQTSPSDVKYGANTPNGKFQTVADKIKLNMTPQKGYESANTPMSNRAEDASKVY
jgi:hypothetical protein